MLQYPDHLNPTIRKCLQHLDVLDVDQEVKQIVYMYLKKLEDNEKRNYPSEN
ncbi:hypothetical protein [Bacillus sp. 2205SS5-2]|uniref:hypothetical protein n=1 Tax=Bacillus sp. 2205SS5-2 TaxID=3109031 RepID=UPI003007EF00